MPPNSSGAVGPPLLTVPMRRVGPPAATPSARSEFEDFMNAYRPPPDQPPREPPQDLPPRQPPEPKVDLGRSIKKLMKRPSPSLHGKPQRKTTLLATPIQSEKTKRPISATLDIPGQSNAVGLSQEKTKRPVSATMDALLCPIVPDIISSDIPTPQLSSQQEIPVPEWPRPLIKRQDELEPLKQVSPVKKKVSIQEEKERNPGLSITPDSDPHCLIIAGSNIGRYMPPRHNPDPILNMRVIPVPDRKYHVIFEFEESPVPPRVPLSTSGVLVVEEGEPTSAATPPREQLQLFGWLREAHAASFGLLLRNVEKMTEFPYLTYLAVSGGRSEVTQRVGLIGSRPMPPHIRPLHFLAGYEEAITISRPPPSTFPEKPSPEKTGFIVCLYQVLPGDDKLRFEQNWVMWTGARQIYRMLPAHMGLKRISVHKSITHTHKVINYCLVCECSDIMDHLTEACSIIDQLRARCCGFIGIFRILDSL